MPEAHPIAPESPAFDIPNRRALYGRATRWRIYYAVVDEAIQVLHVRHGRRSAGADIEDRYLAIAGQRLQAEAAGTLRSRPIGKTVYQPSPSSRLAQRPLEWGDEQGTGGAD